MMLAKAVVTTDLAKIEQNARRIVQALPGIDVVGVTKVTCGTPEIARAMLAGGVKALGESRVENAERLRDAGITAPIWLVRAPTPGQATYAVRVSGVALVSEPAIAEALDRAAGEAGVRYGIVVMADIGDLREGLMPDAVPAFLAHAPEWRNLDVLGIGASLTCYGAIVPDEANLALLTRLAANAEDRLGHKLLVSGGSSTSIDLIMRGEAPSRIDNIRIGEAIVLGVDPATREPIPGLDLHRDAVVLAAPVIECSVKPSKPIGSAAQDAFGNVPTFEDRGERRRAILAVGRQDVHPEGLVPVDPLVEVLGASSDHLVVDVDALPEPPAIGEALEFVPDYSATLRLFTSPYVDKAFVQR
jgi:ornithine racemase